MDGVYASPAADRIEKYGKFSKGAVSNMTHYGSGFGSGFGSTGFGSSSFAKEKPSHFVLRQSTNVISHKTTYRSS